MQLRQFGSTDLQVTELGLGCARIGGIFQNDPKSFVNLLVAARDMGINFFDTADMYSQGESETLIGRAFQRRRDQIVIATKCGFCLPSQRRLIARVKPFVRPLIRLLRIKRDALPSAVRGTLAQDFSPAYIRSAVEGSLRRLRTDYVDLLQLHSVPADIVARGDWVETLEDLKRAGKIRYYGISSDTVESAQAALSFSGVSSVQVVVSLLEQRFAQSVVPLAHSQRVAVIARECLANGLLVKAPEDVELEKYCQSAEEVEARRRALADYRQRARDRGVALARLALEYAVGREGVATALVGVRSLDQLQRTLTDYGV